MEMTAFLEKTMVWPRFLGTVNFAKMIPAIHALMITPTMLWIDKRIAALGHSSLGNLWKNIFFRVS